MLLNKGGWHLPSLRRVTESTTYVPQIDGLRFLALLPVLFWHSGLRTYRFYSSDPSHAVSATDKELMSWLPHGHVGVALFFFISGYIIAFPFLSSKKVSLKHFYLRRLTRLEPPYLVALLLCFLVLSLAPTPQNAPSFTSNDMPLWKSLTASSVYLHGLIFNSPPKLLPPAWSLEIEAQFYILSPLIIFLYMMLRYRSIFIGCLIVTALIVTEVLLDQRFGITGLHGRTLIKFAYGFMLGIVVCRYAIESDFVAKKTRGVFDIGLVLGILALMISGAFEERPLEYGWYILRDAIRAVSIVAIYAGAMRGTLGKRIFGATWLSTLGGMCYSIYLIHVPLMHITAQILFRHLSFHSLVSAWIAGFLILIPVGVAGGLVFYVLVERPCMQRDWPSRLRRKLQGTNKASSVDLPSQRIG